MWANALLASQAMTPAPGASISGYVVFYESTNTYLNVVECVRSKKKKQIRSFSKEAMQKQDSKWTRLSTRMECAQRSGNPETRP